MLTNQWHSGRGKQFRPLNFSLSRRIFLIQMSKFAILHGRPFFIEAGRRISATSSYLIPSIWTSPAPFLYNERSSCHEDTDPVLEARLLRLRSKYLEPDSSSHQEPSFCSGCSQRSEDSTCATLDVVVNVLSVSLRSVQWLDFPGQGTSTLPTRLLQVAASLGVGYYRVGQGK